MKGTSWKKRTGLGLAQLCGTGNSGAQRERKGGLESDSVEPQMACFGLYSGWNENACGWERNCDRMKTRSQAYDWFSGVFTELLMPDCPRAVRVTAGGSCRWSADSSIIKIHDTGLFKLTIYTGSIIKLGVPLTSSYQKQCHFLH